MCSVSVRGKRARTRLEPPTVAASMKHRDGLLKQHMASPNLETVAAPDGSQQHVDRANAAHQQAEDDCASLRERLRVQDKELQQARAELQAVIHAFPDLLARLNSSGTILDYRV